MMMHLYNLLLPTCILITGIMNIVVGINGLKQEKEEKEKTAEMKRIEEQQKKKDKEERMEIKKRWEEVMG